MRWDADNADPGAPGLAGLEQSDQWKLYWQTRLKPSGSLRQHYWPHPFAGGGDARQPQRGCYIVDTVTGELWHAAADGQPKKISEKRR